MPRAAKRWLFTLLGSGLVVGGLFAGFLLAYRSGEAPLPRVGRDAVIFIITDNVRADHTGLCGYDSPLTPTISLLAAEEGSVHTCRAYAPGSWTLPSHASFFTGVGVLEHKAHEYAGTVDDPAGTVVVANPLDNTLPTLAEQMREKGYQTVLLAGNPVVGRGMGLARGYQAVRTAKKFGQFDYPDIVRELHEVLRKELDPLGGPLFLTVNLAEAHRPWKGIPSEHALLPRRSALQFSNDDPEDDWPRYLQGSMELAEQRRFLGHIRDVYDYGIERADDGVRAVLKVVRNQGWCRERCRIVVTSDHGEFIGEHRLIDHGFYSWEANARVFLVAQGTEVEKLPEPLSATAAFYLVRDGRLPDPLPAVEQAAWPHVRRSLHTNGAAFSSTSVAHWVGWTKQMWMDGVFVSYNLEDDPRESDPMPFEPEPDFAALVARVQSVAHTGSGGSDGVMEALKAAGYVE